MGSPVKGGRDGDDWDSTWRKAGVGVLGVPHESEKWVRLEVEEL
jgi:hypothetical protein